MLYDFSERESLIHTLDPRTKLFIAIIFTLLAFVVNTPQELAALVVVVVLYGIIGGLYPWLYWNIITLMIPFVIVMTLVQVLVAKSTHPYPAIDILSFSIPLRGLNRGAVISIRAIIMGISFALFMMATHPYDITQAAVKMGIPFRYAYMVGFSFRFLPLFTDDLRKVREAQASRGLDENRLGPLTKYVTLPILLFPLIMSSMRHAQSIAIALEMRGLSTASTFGRTFLKEMNMNRRDWGFLIIFSAAGILLIIARFMGVIGKL